MKLRNKILMSVMTIVASVTLFSSIAMAESFSFDPATVEVKAGETFTVNVATNDNKGFCAMGLKVTGKNDYVTLTAAEDLGLYTGESSDTNYNKALVGLSWYYDEAFESETNASGNFVKLTYTVNENLAPGTYDAVQVINNEDVSMNMNEDVVDFGTATLKIKVVGDELPPSKSFLASLRWGETAKAATGVAFTVTDATDAENVKTSKAWPVPFGDKTQFESLGSITVGLNVTEIPDTVDVDALTATGELY